MHGSTYVPPEKKLSRTFLPESDFRLTSDGLPCISLLPWYPVSTPLSSKRRNDFHLIPPGFSPILVFKLLPILVPAASCPLERLFPPWMLIAGSRLQVYAVAPFLLWLFLIGARSEGTSSGVCSYPLLNDSLIFFPSHPISLCPVVVLFFSDGRRITASDRLQ